MERSGKILVPRPAATPKCGKFIFTNLPRIGGEAWLKRCTAAEFYLFGVCGEQLRERVFYIAKYRGDWYDSDGK